MPCPFSGVSVTSLFFLLLMTHSFICGKNKFGTHFRVETPMERAGEVEEVGAPASSLQLMFAVGEGSPRTRRRPPVRVLMIWWRCLILPVRWSDSFPRHLSAPDSVMGEGCWGALVWWAALSDWQWGPVSMTEQGSTSHVCFDRTLTWQSTCDCFFIRCSTQLKALETYGGKTPESIPLEE